MERLKTFTDKRGSLTLLEVGQDIPFEVARVFWIHNVPEGQEFFIGRCCAGFSFSSLLPGQLY